MNDNSDAQAKGAAHIGDDSFQATLDQAAKANQPVIIDFYADWCGPCQIAAPIIDKLADEFREKAMIVKLNVDENQKSAQAHGVMSIPTVIVFNKKGEKMEEIDRQIGFPGEAGYRQMLDKALAA